MQEPVQAKLSAVLIPAYRQDGDVRIVLLERGPGGIHGGQIGLPGGKPEPADRSLLETALREAQEEIGLAPSQVKLLAALEPVDARTSGFRVHPFLGLVPGTARLQPHQGEIASVFAASVHELADARRRSIRTFSFPTWAEPRSAEAVFLDGGWIVWGLTLRILDAVVPRILAGQWPDLLPLQS